MIMRVIQKTAILFIGEDVQMNRQWIYKGIGMALCSVFVIFAGAMAHSDKTPPAGENLSPYTVSYLKELGIQHFSIKKFPKPEKIKKHTQITYTEKEIKEFIAMDLENYDSLEDTDKKTVQKGDFIRLEFSTDKSWKDAQKIILKVGKNQFDKDIERDLPGKEKGKIYSVKTRENQRVYIKIKSIVKYIKQTLTPEFIKDTLGFASQKEYAAHIRKQLLAEKKQAAESEAANLFYDKILSESVIELDSQELADYCINYYVKKEQQMALANNETFQEYIQEMYQLEKEDYYKKIYTEGEREIKEIIVTGILAEKIKCHNKTDYNAMKNAVVNHYICMDYSILESPVPH